MYYKYVLFENSVERYTFQSLDSYYIVLMLNWLDIGFSTDKLALNQSSQYGEHMYLSTMC